MPTPHEVARLVPGNADFARSRTKVGHILDFFSHHDVDPLA